MKKTFRLTFFAKNMLMIALGTLLVGGMLTGITVKLQQNMALDNLRGQYVGVANYIKAQLGTELVAQAIVNPGPDNAAGQKLTPLLDQVSELNSNIAQVYVYGADLENGSESIIALPNSLIDADMVQGTRYDNPAEFQAAMETAINDKKPASTGIFTDIYGNWVTVVQPITDDAGKVIAVMGLDINAASVAANTGDILRASLLALALCFLVVLAIQFFAMRRMMQPIRELFGAIGQMNAGDLNVQLRTDRKDDFGDLNRKFSEMAGELKTIIAGVQSRAQQAAKSSSALKNEVEQNMRIQGGVLESAERMSLGARTQESSAEETSRVMEEMSRAIQEIAQTAYQVSDAASDMKTEAGTGGESIERVGEQMSAISASVGRSAARIRQLQERSREIEGIAGLISGIASQTNLLALNAAIEAARAGEHGRGFAVVAEEVRKLADQSATSAGQISGILGLMIKETDEAVVLMEEGLHEVQTGIELSQRTGEAFSRIEAAIGGVSTQTEDMSAVTEQMSASSEEVSASVAELAGIAKESAGSSMEVTQASQLQRESLGSVSASSEELNQMALELNELIAKFKI
ncbi:methyl-accepting chemotaxis protein [Saccharibacillus brassicae]|uniref:Methyl-accepting chemotaxis protein n=1 Tax=Saccharibacillus brassicae TaxID=2583377 RepID=A0A4Y6URJ4_SACBS|nr:methyl-accepting chemotaxis protein [Saccharibacillus brassicae]QDH20282.1 methyl-accepting chemotaxis protein [Saccharibacillus brassicae]